MSNGNSWIMTYTGKHFDVFDPDPEQICMEDIAHALSNICRFTGHCRRFYSVAEHSYWMSYRVKPENAKQALLHDASEAYLMDLARPIKHHSDMQLYRDTESKVERIIMSKYGLATELAADVKEADNRMVISEAAHLLPNVEDWNWPHEPYHNFVPGCFTPDKAEGLFLTRWRQLNA